MCSDPASRLPPGVTMAGRRAGGHPTVPGHDRQVIVSPGKDECLRQTAHAPKIPRLRLVRLDFLEPEFAIVRDKLRSAHEPERRAGLLHQPSNDRAAETSCAPSRRNDQRREFADPAAVFLDLSATDDLAVNVDGDNEPAPIDSRGIDPCLTNEMPDCTSFGFRCGAEREFDRDRDFFSLLIAES